MRQFLKTFLPAPTCKVPQPQLSETKVSVSSVVEEDGERVAVLVQFGSPNDPEVLQGQVVKLVEGHEHVTSHLPDGLHRRERGREREREKK